MARVRAVDDYQAIRSRIEELRRERQLFLGAKPVVERPTTEPDAHIQRHIVKRYFSPKIVAHLRTKPRRAI